tara:strand:+ start:596 stop:982 length:387 start_codon:yes stop_codon:yes gene_type:complete
MTQEEISTEMKKQTSAARYCIIGFILAELLTVGILYMLLVMFIPIKEGLRLISVAAFGVFIGYVFARWAKSWHNPTVDMQMKNWGEIETDMFISKAMELQRARPEYDGKKTAERKAVIAERYKPGATE